MLVFWLRFVGGRSSIIISRRGFGLGGGVGCCGCVRRGRISNTEHQWTMVTAVDLVADDTITDVFDQSLRHNKVVESPTIKQCLIIMLGMRKELIPIMRTYSLI